jgi:uncharacterized protein VirK/YbjX
MRQLGASLLLICSQAFTFLKLKVVSTEIWRDPSSSTGVLELKSVPTDPWQTTFVRKSRIRKVMRLGYNIARYHRDFLSLFSLRRSALLRRNLRARPELLTMVLTPFVCAEWAPSTRIARLIDHHDTLHRLGLRLDPREVREFVTLAPLGSDYFVKLDQPDWMLRDGQLVISLWKGVDRLFSLAFLVSSSEDGLVAYIGGLQGRSQEGVVDIYRSLTKEAHGMRPRDLIVEIHRMFCRALGVTRIYAVADASRHHLSPYYSDGSSQFISSINYDEAWRDRGGVLHGRSFFEMPLEPQRRAEEDIPARKRALYRRRYEMLDQIDELITQAVRG